jgi:hypothetical protein
MVLNLRRKWLNGFKSLEEMLHGLKSLEEMVEWF